MADPILGEQQFIPNQLATDYRTRFYRDPVNGVMSIQYSLDSGLSWRQFISQPPSIATEGWIPTLSETGEIIWKPIASLLTSITSLMDSFTSGGGGGSSLSKSNWVDFSFPGTIETGTEFGYFQVPPGLTVSCYGAQVSLFSPSIGASITIGVMIDSEINPRVVVVVPPSSVIAFETFLSPIVLSSPSTIKLKIMSSPGSGEFLACRLLFNY